LPIRMDPGMAFGTGTHPTTVPCLSMIEMYLKKGDDFLDMGTGSGILMIAAAELGAERVVGIDKDETSGFGSCGNAYESILGFHNRKV
jgi:ribosomal protein L11 methyltransferase